MPCKCKECREHGETGNLFMPIQSYVRLVPGAKGQDHGDKYYPCGHTEQQASWLGCTRDGACRPIDEAITQRYRQWVKAGRPEGGF